MTAPPHLAEPGGAPAARVLRETKPFYRTSEWWVHTLGQLLLWTGALPTGHAPPWLKTVISFAGLIGYGLARGVAKAGVPNV